MMNGSTKHTLKLILYPFLITFLVFIEEYLKKNFILSYFNHGFLYYLLYVFVYVLFGILLANLRKIPEDFLGSKKSKRLIFFVIILYLIPVALPWFGIFWPVQTAPVMYSVFIILGYYIYLLFYSIKVSKKVNQ
jgi:hypothetical protein